LNNGGVQAFCGAGVPPAVFRIARLREKAAGETPAPRKSG